jgi:hypothetical protein
LPAALPHAPATIKTLLLPGLLLCSVPEITIQLLSSISELLRWYSRAESVRAFGGRRLVSPEWTLEGDARRVQYHRSGLDPDKTLDSQIQECLTRLGISSPVEWDVLVFVYRHQASLANAEQIARMLGYPSTVVADALDHLESRKLIRRSRASLGARLYQFVPSEADPPSHSSFQQLITVTGNPAGRRLLVTKLRQRRAELSLAKKKGQNG